MKTTISNNNHRIKNATLWFYIMAAACIVIQLLAVEYHFNKIVDNEWLEHVSGKTLLILTINNIADALILLLPLVLLPPKWRKWCWIVIWLSTLWCLAQLLYMPTYRDLMPFSSFLLTDNVSSTLLNSTLGAFSIGDLEVILPPIALYTIYRIWLKQSIEATNQPLSTRLMLAIASIVVFIILRLLIMGIHYQDNKQTSTFKEQFINDYCVMWTRQGDYLNLNGVVPYCIYCASTSIFDKKELSNQEKQQVKRFINEQPQYTDDDFASARGKNLILLVVESLNSWAIELKINGKEVCPTLNALCRDTQNNIVSLKMKSQVKNGRSSDGIFMYNTGLLPLTIEAVANTYGDAKYPTLAKALGGYDSFYACCDEPTLWNVKNTANNYGYTSFYGKAEIKEAVDNNGYKVDKALLEEVSQILPNLKKPFIGLVATAGMHHPYTTPLEPKTWIQNSGCYTEEVRCYLERLNEFDTELSYFIERLKSQGMYENTMIVIASDHSEMVDFDQAHGRPSIDQEGDNCVFIAINSGQCGFIEGPIGQIDIYPTLLDLLGLNDNKWKGLGYSLMRNNIASAATSPYSLSGNGTLIKRQQEAWTISDLIIKSRWFEQ